MFTYVNAAILHCQKRSQIFTVVKIALLYYEKNIMDFTLKYIASTLSIHSKMYLKGVRRKSIHAECFIDCYWGITSSCWKEMYFSLSMFEALPLALPSFNQHSE